MPMQDPDEAPADQRAHQQTPHQQPPRTAGRGPQEEGDHDHSSAYAPLRPSCIRGVAVHDAPFRSQAVLSLWCNPRPLLLDEKWPSET
jgi:hypothetical protein